MPPHIAKMRNLHEKPPKGGFFVLKGPDFGYRLDYFEK